MEAPFSCFAMMFRNLSFACLFSQCVLVSASSRILNSCGLLLLQSSLREWASVPRSRPLVFMNSILDTLGFFCLECYQMVSFYLLLLF